jgi:hypothetical protein
MFEGLRKPMELIVIVVTLLCCGCPVQAIVHAFGLDERSYARPPVSVALSHIVLTKVVN